jgi:L-fuconolactonase
VRVVDAQLHCWLTDQRRRPWDPEYRARTVERAPNVLLQSGIPMSPETLLVEMARAGVDAGVLTPQGVYGIDNSMETDASLDFPRKFAVMGWVDTESPNVVADLRRSFAEGMLGIRLFGLKEDQLRAGTYAPVLECCAQAGRAIAMMLTHPISEAQTSLFYNYPDTPFLIDHLGIGHAPPAYGLAPADPFDNLAEVLKLSRYPNVGIKLTGASALSHTVFPFEDLHGPICRIIDAFGPSRVYWGSDYTRTGSLHPYAEESQYLWEIPQLEEATVRELCGTAILKVLGWTLDPKPVSRATHPGKLGLSHWSGLEGATDL